MRLSIWFPIVIFSREFLANFLPRPSLTLKGNLLLFYAIVGFISGFGASTEEDGNRQQPTAFPHICEDTHLKKRGRGRGNHIFRSMALIWGPIVLVDWGASSFAFPPTWPDFMGFLVVWGGEGEGVSS